MKKSLKTPPPCMPDQVLCKRATIERMRGQQARWMAQREAALSQDGGACRDEEPTELDSTCAARNNQLAERRRGSEPVATDYAEQTRRLVEQAVLEEMCREQEDPEMRSWSPKADFDSDQVAWHSDATPEARFPAIERALAARARRMNAQPAASARCFTTRQEELAEEDEDFAEIDEMQDWMAAMEFQIDEIDF